MKHIDYLYFNIYNYFYKVSQYRPTLDPRMQAMYLFSLGSGGWLLLLESLYLRVIRHSRFSSKAEATFFAVSLYMLIALLFSYIFIMKDRDQKIFGRYEELSKQNPKKRRHFIISITILLLPYAGLLSFPFLFPKSGL